MTRTRDSREALILWLDDTDNAARLARLLRHEAANTLDSMSDDETSPTTDRDSLVVWLGQDAANVARCVRLLSYDDDGRLDEMVVWHDFTDSEREQAIQFWASDIYSSEVFV